MEYRGQLIYETKNFGATSHWHCSALKLYGYPTRGMLLAAIDAALEDDGITLHEGAERAAHYGEIAKGYFAYVIRGDRKSEEPMKAAVRMAIRFARHVTG